MGEEKGSSSGYFVVSSHQHAREVSGAVRDNIIRGDNLVLGQVSADEFRPGNRLERGGRGGLVGLEGGVGFMVQYCINVTGNRRNFETCDYLTFLGPRLP